MYDLSRTSPTLIPIILPLGNSHMFKNSLVTDEEYAKEVKSHSDYLNWVFGVSTIFLAIACLQFATPSRAAVICLGAIVPMYVYALTSLPVSLNALRTLYSETRDAEVKEITVRLELKFHGWQVIYTNFILWYGLVIYILVLFSDFFKPFVNWVKA